MAFAARSADSMPMSEINMTPMVGLLLALTVVFMLMGTPNESWRLSVNASSFMGCILNDPLSEGVELSIKANGELYLDGVSLTEGQLASQLRVLVNRLSNDERVYLTIRTEPTTRYERFADVVSLANNNGITHPALMPMTTY